MRVGSFCFAHHLALGSFSCQDLAGEDSLPVYNRCAIHALSAAYLNLICQLTTVPTFCQHVHEVWHISFHRYYSVPCEVACTHCRNDRNGVAERGGDFVKFSGMVAVDSTFFLNYGSSFSVPSLLKRQQLGDRVESQLFFPFSLSGD